MAANLGTLTIDLIAKVGGFVAGMDKAGRESKKWRDKVEKDVKTVGKAIGGLAVATAAGLTALTVNTVRAANEISKLAQLAGTSTQEFQFFAAGAKAVGIEQEKLGDIFKDVNDKVGDFLQTGGGPLADFFDNIAPKVGVTADQFRKLSGPEALGLYVSSLEKAGASQQDMTFFLEAIASDATALLPLLKNNAEGFRILGEQAAKAGAIMDDETIRAATELQAVSILTDQALTGLSNQIAAGLLPVLADLSGALFDTAANTEIAREAGQTFGSLLKGIAAIAFGAYSSFQLLGKSIAAIGAAFDAADIDAADLLFPQTLGAKVARNFDAFKNALDIGFQDVGDSVTDYAKVLDGIWDAGSGDGADTDFAKRIKLIADLLEESRKRNTANGIVIDQNAEENKRSSEAAEKAIRSQIEALQIQAAVLGLTTKQETLYKLAIEGANAEQLKQADIALSTVEAFEAQTKAIKDAADAQENINKEAISIIDSLLSEEESVKKSYERRRQIILDNTAVTGEAQTELLRRLEENRNEDLLEINGGYWERYLAAAEDALASFDDLAGNTIENFSSRFGSAFEAMIFDAQTLEESILQLAEGMARSIVNALGEMAAQWLAYQAVQLFVGKSAQTSAATTLTANAQATSFQAGLAAFASTAAIPIVGPGLAPAALAAALAVTQPLAAAVSTAALAGIAHDGIDSVPQTGTWLLEKGERVTTAETSAKLDATLSRIESGQTDTRMTTSGVNVNMTVVTPDANSFRKSERQVSHSLRRGLNQ